MDHNFKVLRQDSHLVADGVRRLAKTVDKLTDRLDELVGRPADTDLIKRMERIHTAEMANLEMKYRLEADALVKDRAADKRRLDRLETDLQFAAMKAAMAAQELEEARHGGYRRIRNDGNPEDSEDPDVVIRSLYLALRESVVDFINSSVIQLGPLPDNLRGIEIFCPPHFWNAANAHQRRRRVMAQVFYLLFRRILRPGLRVFGVQAFIKSSKHHAISIAEAHLRALERELEARRGKHPLPQSHPLLPPLFYSSIPNLPLQ